MDLDDFRPRPKPQITVGEKLDEHSIAELDQRIAALAQEIERTRAERDAKKARVAAAEALFKS